jgi:hypothetical protein
MVRDFLNSNRVLFVLLFNIFVISLTYCLFMQLGVINITPDEFNMVQYDASWFKGIRQHGYSYTPNQMSNMAFFPLFPYLWKWSFLDGFQVSIFNLILFVFAFVLLLGKKKYSIVYLLVITSLPCFIFMFLPYSEALFFFFGTILISGYQRNSKPFRLIGLLGCCLTRSVSTFFIPAVIITELLAYRDSNMTRRQLWVNMITNIGVCLLSILVVVLIQGVQTGKWFYYIEVQQYWKRNWIFPSIPFTVISPAKVLGIDAVSLVVGIIAIYFCFKWGYQYLQDFFPNRNDGERSSLVCKSVYFSALFIAAIAITDTCFTYNIDGRTNMQCMNRHLLCTAFAVWFIHWLMQKFKPEKLDRYFIITIFATGVFFTGVFEYSYLLVYYLVFCLSIYLTNLSNRFSVLLIFLYLFNVFFMVIFYQDFLSGFWIG